MAVEFTKFPDFESCSGLGLDKTIYQGFQGAINVAIDKYNNALTPLDKISALDLIRAAFDDVDTKSSADNLIGEFHDKRKEIFLKLKNAYAGISVDTMLRRGETNNTLTRYIADMSPEAADKFLEVLSGTWVDLNSQLDNLYGSGENFDAQAWQNFRKKYSIEYIGGSNSKNYKLTNIDPNDPSFGDVFVLKVENRLGRPRLPEKELRSALGDDLFTPVHCSRQARGMVCGQIISRTLVITDLYEAGSLEECGEQVRAQETYEFANLEELPENNPANAEMGKLYLGEGGEYVVHNFDGQIFEGLVKPDALEVESFEALSENVLRTATAKGHIEVQDFSETFNSCGDYMGQMIKGLDDIQKAGYCLSDAKYTNWLVDAKSKVHLGDTKSLIAAPDGLFKKTKYRPLSSNGFKPSEIGDQSFSESRCLAR